MKKKFRVSFVVQSMYICCAANITRLYISNHVVNFPICENCYCVFSNVLCLNYLLIFFFFENKK
jgi:hypothetical protein